MAKFKSVDSAAVESSGSGPLAGPVLVKQAIFRVVQPRAFEGRDQAAPHTALVFSVVPLDQDGDELADAEAREVAFGLGGKSLANFHPGTASSPTDDDPQDAGDEVNSEGPTIYCSEGATLNTSSGYWIFRNSLVKAGFSKEIIEQTWAPAFEGMKFVLASVTQDKLEKYGSKARTEAPKPGERPITMKVCENIIVFPYKSKATKSAVKPATNGTAHAAANGDTDAARAAVEQVVAFMATKYAGQTIEKFPGQFLANYGQAKADNKVQPAARKLVATPADFTPFVEAVNGVVDDNGAVIFPAAE